MQVLSLISRRSLGLKQTVHSLIIFSLYPNGMLLVAIFAPMST